MRTFSNPLRKRASQRSGFTFTVCEMISVATLVAAATFGVVAQGQAPASPELPSSAQVQPTPAPPSQPDPQSPPAKNPTLSQGPFSIQAIGGEIKEDQLKQILVGKPLYLRSGYQENNLEFDEHGRLMGHSPQGSYTLSQIQINRVRLSKHKLELEGDRYALHFLGAAPFEDVTTATNRVKITPKKKTVRISFDREQVETPKKKKEKKNHKGQDRDQNQDRAKAETSAAASPEDSAAAAHETASVSPDAAPAQNLPADHASDDKKVTTTTSPAHASQLLLNALDNVFSNGIDERLIAAMPDFWKLYYQAAEAKADNKPTDSGVLRQSAVDQKAKLISVIDPPSNEFAQANGVAGMALYHAVIGSDGKVEEVVAARPIGFGLDESAERTIRKASFQPAMKDGKPVPVALDVVVSFRIYSKRTSQTSAQAATVQPDAPALPGPYTIKAQSAAQTSPAQ